MADTEPTPEAEEVTSEELLPKAWVGQFVQVTLQDVPGILLGVNDFGICLAIGEGDTARTPRLYPWASV